jgi:hypothetical protein
MVEQIINALPESYDTFVCVISSEKELLTFEELIRRLQLEENQSQNCNQHIGDEEALIVKFKHVLQNQRGGNYY